MSKKALAIVSLLMVISMVLGACAQATPAAPQILTTEVIRTVVVTQIVEVQGTPQVKEVIKTVVVQATPEPAQQQLLVFNWWTAPGEKEAADAMFKAFNDKYPNIKIVNNPVPGGGGVSQRAVLQARLTAGLPPDTWQTLGGAELKAYVDAGQLVPIDDVYQSLGYDKVIPGPLLKAVTVNGHQYSVPLNMHIQNILYYNKKLFDDNKLTPPTTYDELIATCDAIKKIDAKMACLGLGSKEKWGDAFVFDSILMELIGPEQYVKIYKGEVDLTKEANYKEALTRFRKIGDYINQDHAGLSWDQATGLLPAKQAAMTIMGTWAIGALEKGGGWKAGVDFGAVTFPQKPQRVLLFHPDTYGLAKGAPDADAAKNWLGVVASPELQIPTDVIQGGLFARTDIDATKFPDPIRQELQTYVSKNPGMLILDQHGSIAPSSFTSEYWNALASFLADPKATPDGTIKNIMNLFTTYNVKEGAAWYQWP